MTFRKSTLFILSALVCAHSQAQEKTAFVDPFIGSAGHGHVFVGANVPFGAVQLGPTNIGHGWDWCSGYNYSSPEILGFTSTHLSGTGIGDLNDLMLVPANGDLQLEPMKENQPQSGYGSFFSKSRERVAPGFYQVYLDKYKVDAQLTSTKRVGIHRYHFDKTDNAHLLLDLGYCMNWDLPTQTAFKQINDTTFVGYRFSKGWAKDQRLFFALKTSEPIDKIQLFDSSAVQSGSDAAGRQIKAALFFNAQQHPNLIVKLAISPTSEKNALLNLNTEAKSNDFDAYRRAADKDWNQVLDKVDFQGDSVTKKLFYTALYHMYLGPSLFDDVNGDNLGTDKKIHPHAGYDTYTTMSLWDTYRAWSPFMTLTEPSIMKDVAKSMLAIYQQQGRLPVWPLVGNETDCMVGNPGVIVLADAFLKGLVDPADQTLAYEALKHTAMRKESGLEYVDTLSYIPADKFNESVSWALEFAIADAGIARVAKKMGKTQDANYFEKRSQLYRKYFDKETGFFNARLEDGSFRRPFDPYKATFGHNDFTEGNAWQYLWLVPQHVYDLIQLLGGKQTFTAKLDSLFTISSHLDEGTAPDISGLIGQYAQGDEPSHHISYLYNYVGQPYKTAKLIRQIVDSFYTTKPDGLCGNEDVGQMSAWLAFSALGMYPVDPTAGIYVFGSPLMKKATIHLDNGKVLTINALNNNDVNIYIQKVLWNGKDYPFTYIRHAQLEKGGNLTFVMGKSPSKIYGIKANSYPPIQ